MRIPGIVGNDRKVKIVESTLELLRAACAKIGEIHLLRTKAEGVTLRVAV
jgi:hypothetical protein